MLPTDIAAYIDHTVLKPNTTEADIQQLCTEAKTHHFAAICVPPTFVAIAQHALVDTNVKIATVVGFPFGYQALEAKLAEIVAAIQAGADELDMVHNIASVKSGNWEYAEKEIAFCADITSKMGKGLKIILETALLTDEEIVKCCTTYSRHNIQFLKTSTGYADKGATVEAVTLMREHTPQHISIKASGGIRTFAFAKQLIEAGAVRIGTSSGVQIVNEAIALQ
jgi:deoxyribose-phosphate aldolase